MLIKLFDSAQKALFIPEGFFVSSFMQFACISWSCPQRNAANFHLTTLNCTESYRFTAELWEENSKDQLKGRQIARCQRTTWHDKVCGLKEPFWAISGRRNKIPASEKEPSILMSITFFLAHNSFMSVETPAGLEVSDYSWKDGNM